MGLGWGIGPGLFCYGVISNRAVVLTMGAGPGITVHFDINIIELDWSVALRCLSNYRQFSKGRHTV